MGIPSYTRIIVKAGDDRAAREYGISRSVLLLLILMALVFVAFLVMLMHSFATKHDERQTIVDLKNQLTKSQAEVQVAHELAADLEEMRVSQEQLLMMLGIEGVMPAAADTVLSQWLDQNPASSTEAMRRAATVVSSAVPDRWPAKGYITQEYLKGDVVQGIRPHLGTDIAGPKDGPVVAAASGVVVRTGEDDFLGNFVEIQHGAGYLTVYGHCSRIAVSRGDHVAAGQVVAYVGDTGQTTGVHLHFEVWRQGEAIDPRLVVDGEPEQN